MESPSLNPVDAKLSSYKDIETSDNINTVKCLLCSYETKRKSALTKHMLVHAQEGEIQWHRCESCPYRAKRKADLKLHLKLKHAADEDIDWFPCHQCSYRAKRKSSLKHHQSQRHARDQDIKWFVCTQCSYRSKQACALTRHTQTRHGSNMFTRSEFQTEEDVSNVELVHMNHHAKDEEMNVFRCNFCVYRTRREVDLEAHVMFYHPGPSGESAGFTSNVMGLDQTDDEEVVEVPKMLQCANEEIDLLKCNFCGYRADEYDNLAVHFLTQHSQELCDKRNPVSVQLNDMIYSDQLGPKTQK